MFGLRSARSRAVFGCLVVLMFGISAVALASTTAATDQTGRTTLWLTIGLSVAAFVVVAGVPVLVVSVLRPLAALRASAGAIAAGDPETRAKVSGPEEVASLARDFNAMTDALAAKAQEYIDTTNLTGVTLLRVDKDNRVSFVNDAMCEFLGKSREEILGTPIVDYLHPEDAPSTIRTVLNMVQSKGLVTGIVSRYVTPRGTRVVEWNGYPIFDEDDRYAGVHGTGRDITERRQAEEALRESEQRLRAQYKGMPIPTYTWRRVGDDFVLIDHNDAAEAITNGGIVNFLGITASEMYQNMPEILDEFWRCFTEQTCVKREMPYRFRSTGESRHFAVTYAPVPPDLVLVHTEDITERKQAEDALRTKDCALEASINGIALADLEGNIIYVNPSLLRMWGYDHEGEMLGRHVVEFWQAEDKARQAGRALRDRASWIGELVGVRKDGSTFDVQLSASMVTDAAHKPVCIMGSFVDVSERKLAEEALRESEKRYRLLAENVTDVIWTMDTNLRFTYMSPSVTRLRGYTVEEAMAQTLEETLTPTSFKVAMKTVAEEWALEQTDEKDLARWRTLEVENTCKDGSTVWFEVKIAFLHDEDKRPAGIVGVSRDISERKLAEEALRESKERYRLLAENAADVIWTMDLNLRLTYVSPSVARLRGYTVQEAMGQTVKEMLTPASLQVVKKAVADERAIEQMEEKDPSRSLTLELEQNCKDGSTVWTEVKVAFLRDPDGQPIGMLGISRDITERKRAEEALRESEGKYRRLVQDSIDAILVTEGPEIRLVNQATLDMFGYQRDEEVVGQPFTKLVAPEYRELMMDRGYARDRGDPVPNRYEFKALRKNGSKFDAEVSIGTITYQGKVLRQAVVRDISERKRAEEALRESEEKYRRVVQDSLDGIVITQGLEMRLVNPALLKMFGCQSEEEMVGHPFTDFISPEYRELLVERGYAREKGQDEPEQYEYKALRKDGSEFHAEISVTRITYQGKPARQGIVRDITDRKRAEEALRESEERYRSLVETSPDAIILSDLNTNIIMVNERAVRLLGYDNAEEVIGRNSLDFIAPEDRQRAAENALRTLQTGTTQSVEYTLLRKDGTSFPAELSASSIVDAQGRPHAFTGVVRDITDRKRAEEALQKARENIESRVERRVQEVNGYGLTFRELTVLHLVAAGESDKEIATVLGISPLTAHKHLANILDKMGAASRTEAGVRALREGLLD